MSQSLRIAKSWKGMGSLGVPEAHYSLNGFVLKAFRRSRCPRSDFDDVARGRRVTDARGKRALIHYLN
jgi:hypothetical protein